MTIQQLSSIYSTHTSRPRKRPTSTVLLRAITKVMKAELSAAAIARWNEQLDEAIGEPIFNRSPTEPRELSVVEAPKAWCPAKPQLAHWLLEAVLSKEPLKDGRPAALAAPLTLGSSKGKLAKIISRRLVDLVVAKHFEELRASGELRSELFASEANKQLCAAIARHATDVLTYVAARAKELDEGDGQVIIEMQTVDQCLHGRETRGSGLVVCERGMSCVEKAAQAMIGIVETDALSTDPAAAGIGLAVGGVWSGVGD